MGAWSIPVTVKFCSGMTVLSREATEIALIAFPGLDVNHGPTEPSFPGSYVSVGVAGAHGQENWCTPAAMVTIFPDAAIRLDTTELVLSVHPSAPPSDMVRMS